MGLVIMITARKRFSVKVSKIATCRDRFATSGIDRATVGSISTEQFLKSFATVLDIVHIFD